MLCRFLTISIFFVLIGCTTGNDSDATDHNLIWSTQSTSLIITRFNGYTPTTEERYSKFEYTSQSLPVEIKDILTSVSTTTSELSCQEDAVSYQIDISDKFGITNTYHSNNKACNDYSNLIFIDVIEITQIINLIE